MKIPPETISFLISAAVAAMLIALPFMLITLLAEIRKAKAQQAIRENRTGANNRRRTKTNPAKSSKNTPASNGKLEKKLLAMLQGDRTGAERLLKAARQGNPGRPNEWYWEKVISDLERDRR